MRLHGCILYVACLCKLGLSRLVCGMACHALKLNGTKLVCKHFTIFCPYTDFKSANVVSTQSFIPNSTGVIFFILRFFKLPNMMVSTGS